jgi:pentafunctional AROM polypeptide
MVPELLSRVCTTSKVGIITDTNVAPLYAEAFSREIAKKLQSECLIYTIPPGEGAKTRSTKEKIEDWMLENRFLRDSCLVALGGGVVGDLVGFIASTYMRGIQFVQVPTTILAMVDSSIGGKTGVDTPKGKNLIGSFYQPKAVFIDISVLKSLTMRHISNGLAEAIKTGLIGDEELFEFMERHSAKILERDMEALRFVILKSAKFKARVVVEDEKEKTIRAILNFGHSIGHAIEAILGMESNGELLHGEAISIGMVLEATLARKLGYLHTAVITRLVAILQAYKLPFELPHSDLLKTDEIVNRMSVDKKNTGKTNHKQIVMLSGVGKTKENPWTTSVDDSTLKKLLCPAAMMSPGFVAKGSVYVPGSKSVSNRILVLAALGCGQTRIRGLLHSEDTQVMLDSLKKLGVSFHWEENGEVLNLIGTGGKFKTPSESLYLANAGTAARFLTTMATLVENGGSVLLTGSKRMQERPAGDLVDALKNIGCEIEYKNPSGVKSLPIIVKGCEGFPGGEIMLKADVSSQFVSSILLSAPYAKNSDVVLKLDQATEVVSRTYIDMTISLMRQFGAKVESSSDGYTYKIRRGNYSNPREVLVEGDASSASYPLALAAITGGSVTVKNVGSMSTQGDAQFCRLLENMGTLVIQTDSETFVQGPSSLHQLKSFEMNMADLTDLFMTAAVLAAVASGTSKITGIANQRVKECNRIAVMVQELTAIGVNCGELPDGMWIEGTSGNISHLKERYVKCHKDHRIAMSFAVLGSVVPNLVITDKNCVGKTYSEFWEHVETFLNLKLEDSKTVQLYEASKSALTKKLQYGDSLILIGMRGVGKTTLGHFIANKLGYEFLDLDQQVEVKCGMKIRDFVSIQGWNAFRKIETEVLEEVSKTKTEKYIISCGGGVVESSKSVEVLEQLSNVILLTRDIIDIESILKKDFGDRAVFDESLSSVWERRKPLFEKVSNYEFVISSNDFSWDAIELDFELFIKRVLAVDVIDTHLYQNSFFLSLTYTSVEQMSEDFSELVIGVDALEFRVDSLTNHLDETHVLNQLALLRRYVNQANLGNNLPIIFTVRSKSQGGNFSDNPVLVSKLLKRALKAGVEYIDIESTWPADIKEALLAAKKHSMVILSYHDPSSNGGPDLDLVFSNCFHVDADIVKVVIRAQQAPEDVMRLYQAQQKFAKSSRKPTIALAMHAKGKLSRVLNQVMTPVTHPLLPIVAAPGQLSAAQINESRISLGMLSPLNFYLIGSPIQLSPSPAMHNAGFKQLGLPFHYHLFETLELSESLKTLLSSPDFGGASVTIPLKEKLFHVVDSYSESARSIGSINVIHRRGNSLFGDNTDWIGIYQLIKQANISLDKPALVLGAGGTSRAAIYALQKLGLEILLYNRTAENGLRLQEQFGVKFIDSLENIGAISILVNTISAKAEFTCPERILAHDEKPLILDVVRP